MSRKKKYQTKTQRILSAHGDDFGAFELSDIGDGFKKAVDVVTDVASSGVDAVGDVIDKIPVASNVKGWAKDFANGPLKDFANTSLGHIILVAAVNSMSFGMGAALAPTVGPQIAGAVQLASIAAPNMLAGDDFIEAWTKEAIDRVVQVAEFFGGKAGEAVGNLVSKQIEKLSKKLAGMTKDQIKGLTFQALAKLESCRDDAAALALDLADRSKKRFFPQDFDVKDGHYIKFEKAIAKDTYNATQAARKQNIIATTALGYNPMLSKQSMKTSGGGRAAQAYLESTKKFTAPTVAAMGRAKPPMTGAVEAPPPPRPSEANKLPFMAGGAALGVVGAVAAGLAAPLVAGAGILGAGLAYVLKK